MFSLCNKQVDTTYVSTLPIWYIVIHSVVPFTKRLEIYTRKGQSKQSVKEARLPSMRLHVIFLMKCSHQAALLEIHAGSTSKTSEFL